MEIDGVSDACLSLISTLKSKELSPVIGHKSMQASGATVPPVCGQQSNSQSPHSAEQSPHTLHKGSSHMGFLFNQLDD